MKHIFSSAMVIAVLALTSCSTYQHSHRLSNVPEKDVVVADKIGVQMRIDVNKVVRSTSNKHSSVKDAKDEAYYRAIVDNNIHVLVDPIYSVETSAKFLIFGGKSRATVIGFAGYYSDAKPLKQINDELEAEKIKKEQAAFDRTLKDMEFLMKNNVIASQSSETASVSCMDCGEGPGVEEITKTTTKSSIIDEYNKFVKGVESPSSALEKDDNDSSKSSMKDEEVVEVKMSLIAKVKSKITSLTKKK